MKKYRNRDDVRRAVQEWRRQVEQAAAGERALHVLYRSFIQRALDVEAPEEARKLLCSTQCSIQEISMRTGFGDVNYFIQQFKTHYGQTPKQYQQLEARRLEM